jgi:hypothetical protein
MMPFSSVGIIVVNWNNVHDTLDCLRSLAHLDYSRYKVLVVDNGSGDDSVLRIRAKFPEVGILETGKNLGYAGGNNLGIRHALEDGADLICILNNDVMVEPDFLTPLLEALAADPRAGIATPLIVDGRANSKVWALGASVDWKRGSVQRLHAGRPTSEVKDFKPFEVGVAPGSALLVRGVVFEQAGFLDERYFLYYEEADWCIGVQKAGYKILAVPDSLVIHKVSDTLGQASPVTDYYMTRNRFHFIRRHWSGVGRIRLVAETYLREAAAMVAYTVKSNQGRRHPHRTARLHGLRDSLLGRWGEMGVDTIRACCPEAYELSERESGEVSV